ncbi:MAG: VTT domain-containing protein [Syntrophomonas sp.]
MKHFYRNIQPYSVMAILILLVCIYLFTPAVNIQVNRGLSMLSLHDVKGLTMQFGSLGNQAALLSITLTVLQLLYVPLPFTTVLAATVTTFGSGKGMFICWLGIVLGAATAFGIVRTFIRIIFDKKLFYFDKSVQSYGVLLIIAAWLIPGWPGELAAYLAGLSCLDFSYFIGAAAIAAIPNIWLTSCWGEIIPRPFSYALYLISMFCIVTIIIKVIKRKMAGE